MYPSDDLIQVCQVTEAKIQDLMSNATIFKDKKILQRICLKTTTTVFTQHPEVLKEAELEALHRYKLMKGTSLIFAVLRLKHLAKEKNIQEKKLRIRKKLSRLVIFSHQ